MIQRLEPHNNLGMKEHSTLMTRGENPELQAKQEELEKLGQHNVYESVDDRSKSHFM